MDWQFLIACAAFGITAGIAVLMAAGILPGATAVIDAWSVARPTIPRQWLGAAFWISLALPIAGCGLLVSTAARVLPAVWSDSAQFLFWLALGVEATVMRRRVLIAVSALFLAFSAYAVVTHL